MYSSSNKSPVMLAKNVFINRTNRQSAVETMTQVALQLQREKRALYMYPEGTRSHQSDKSLLSFKKGAFHLAIQGQMPIVPIVASTYSPCYSERDWVFEPCTLQIRGESTRNENARGVSENTRSECKYAKRRSRMRIREAANKDPPGLDRF
jgi:1-acyl-sn-glycerol-3-phosphate acyltransferase